MTRSRDRIEKKFAQAASLFYRHHLITLLIVALFTGVLFWQLPKLTLDTSTEGFLHEQDPDLLAYNDFRDQFGNTEMVIVAIKSKDIFSLEFLQKLKEMHIKLRDQVPYVDDINSLINARSTRGEKDRLIVEDLLEHWPTTPEELAAVKERALANPLYNNMLISEKGDFTAIVLQMQAYSSQGEAGVDDVLAGFTEDTETGEQKEKIYLTDAETSEVVQAVTGIVATYRSPDFKIYVAGGPVVTDFLKKAMIKDMRKFMLLVGLTIGTFLFLMFRRASAVFLPLLVVAFSLLSTLALMAVFGTPLKLPTQILPSFLMAVGVGDSVHILAIFFHRFRKNRGDKAEAVEYAVGHSGLAVFMTSLTTAGGLLSFSTADVAPIADLGIYAAAGVMLALLYTIVLLPSLLALIPLKEKKNKETHKNTSRLDTMLSAIGHIATGNPKTILVITALIFIVSIVGITRIKFSHDVVRWYKKDSPIRIASETIDEEMRGSIALEIVLDTGKVNGLYDPELLQRIDNSVEYVEQLHRGKIFAGKAWSITTILKEIHQALNENRAEFYRVPDDPDLIPQEFLLFENSGSDDLEDVTDSQFSKARFTIKVPFQDAVAYTDFIQTVNAHFQQTFPELKITTTGMTAIIFQTMARVIRSMAKSYIIALVVITALMILLIGKLRTGLLSMVPNLFPIFLTLGIMGWFQVPLDLFTMLVGSISIGLAVDDTIHFMHNFRRYFEQSNDAKQAVMETLHSTGRAMLITTCVLSLGFFVFMFASMNNLVNFGWLTGFTILTALLADYFIAPALLVLVNREKMPPVKRVR
ncbi:MAG: MMPL family transporter [Candidatus Electrothrix gigas]